MMTISSRRAAIALTGLLGATFAAGAASAQQKTLAPLSATPVRPSPIHLIPSDGDAGDTQGGPGPEQQAAMAEPTTLNAQYASLTQQVAASPAAVQAAMAAAQPATADLQAQAPTQNPPPNTPSVAIARRVIDAAGAFERYMRTAAAIHADFGDGEAVTRALETGATYDQGQLEAGAVAYAALMALQEPTFVHTLSQLSPDPTARMAVARQLVAEPEAVMQAPGARLAAARAATVIGRMGGSLYASGAAVKQAAYDVQHQAWSRAAILAPQAELAKIKTQSTTPVALKSEDTASLITSLVAMRRSSETPMGPSGPVSPLVARGLALAALAIMGQADEDHAEQIAPLLVEARSADCVKTARLALYECLSVAGPQYENVFCLGQHAMMDTGQCVVKAAGWTTPTTVAGAGSVAVPIAAQAAAPAAPPPVMVPVALASEAPAGVQ
jgi:hypothetical protein